MMVQGISPVLIWAINVAYNEIRLSFRCQTFVHPSFTDDGGKLLHTKAQTDLLTANCIA